MSVDTFLTPDGCRLAYESVGEGTPVLWQHGLGADRRQPAEVFPQLAGVRRITLECRGHGESEIGDPERISIAGFADDALLLLDHLNLKQAVVGGISLGAAIALRLAALHPERVSGLILARPAWPGGPIGSSSLETMAPYALVAKLIRDAGVKEGLKQFAASLELAAVKAVSPDNAASLLSFFSRPNPESTVLLLSRIARDSPAVGEAIERISVPTLIIANGQEFVHPLAYARGLHTAITHSVLQVIPSKTIDRRAYTAEFEAALRDFLSLFAV